ncbi:MAG: hypothetical protein QOE92_1396 [Chloroflexota bacterium]|nr:hypothetical protein [Chloroflexota bacterium]
MREGRVLIRRLRSQRQRGQSIVLLVLAMTLIIGMASLAIDAGLSYVDQRDLRKAADLASLGGAGSIGTSGFTSSLQTTVLNTAQAYAWQNVKATAPAITCTGAQLSGNTCTVSGSNYTVTATYPYTPQNGASFPPENSVGVDITHNYQTPGFLGALGFSHRCTGPQYTGGNMCVSVHAAAVVKAGSSTFPYALATRFLQLQGSGTASVYGASMISECAGDGTGSFVTNSSNGGIYFNGGTTLTIGQATQGGAVSSPAAILLADPQGVNCTSTSNQNASASWNGFQDKACFLSTCPGYNASFAFNYNAVSPDWDDHCWQGGNAAKVLVSAVPPSAEASTGVRTPGSPAPASCTRAGNPPSDEGSYLYSNWPGFPNFLSPSGIIATSLGVNAPRATYTSTPGTTMFAPGWYVFDGNGASISGNSRTIGCNAGTGPGGMTGCVFTFRNGADIDLGNNSNVNCGAPNGPCAFEFKPGSTMAISGSGTAVNLNPISIPRIHPTTGLSSPYNLPIIYSTDNSDCLGTSAPCSVAMSQSNNFNVGGTIFVPHGVVSVNANAAPVSGQLIADTVKLQGGNSSDGGAVAYKGALVTPIPGPAALFE